MYAVIKTGGKQYRVAAGEKLKIEQIPADVGTEITLDQVLMVGEGESVKIGSPMLAGATVTAKVIAQGRHPKVTIFKMRRRKHYQKHQGHRQNYTELLISQIASDLGVFKAEAKTAVKAQGKEQAGAKADDLTKVEGIGPKINEILQGAGIRTFSELAATPVDRLKELLAQAGSHFANHDPTTWPEQAALAAKGDWEAFDKLKAELDGGRRV